VPSLSFSRLTKRSLVRRGLMREERVEVVCYSHIVISIFEQLEIVSGMPYMLGGSWCMIFVMIDEAQFAISSD